MGKKQEVDLKLDLPAEKLPQSKIAVENGNGSTLVIKPKGLRVRTTAWGTILFLLGITSFAVWLGCSIKASQDTYQASQALQLGLDPQSHPYLLVVLVVLPLTYPVMLCLGLWVLRWRQRIKARRDELGDLGSVRSFLFFGFIILMLLCVALLIVVMGLSAYALWGGVMFALDGGATFFVNHMAPSFNGFKAYAQGSSLATQNLTGLILGFEQEHAARLQPELRNYWHNDVLIPSANLTIPALEGKGGCSVYCYDLSSVAWLSASGGSTCICDASRLVDAIPAANSAWRFVLGAWVALLASYASSALLALVLGMRHAATSTEKRYVMKRGKGSPGPGSPLHGVNNL